MSKKKISLKKWIKSIRFKRIFWIAFWIQIPILILLTIWVLYLARVISDRFTGTKWDLPSKVYSDSMVIYPGMTFEKGSFENKLKKLGYAPTRSSKMVEGNYAKDGDDFHIYLHDFDYPREKFDGFDVTVEFDDDKIESIARKKTGEHIYSFQLEPELIAEIFSSRREERKLEKLEDMPKWLPDILVYIEDRRFYDHFGIDLKSIARAFVVNLKSRRIVQGGSTITQQLVRNFFLYHRQTMYRKFVEAMMSVILEVLHSKQEILESYMNEVWMGQKGSVAIHGFGEASRFYFGKDIKHLNHLEGAVLTGMIKSAAVYSPYQHFDRSLKRARQILESAYKARLIPPEEYRRALNTRLEVKEFQKWKNNAPYFTNFIQNQLLEFYSESLITTGGLRIFTTLDMDMQRKAESAVKNGLEEIEKLYPQVRVEDKDEKLQACFISVKPQTGYIKAYVGGRDFGETQFDRIVLGKRQPGSLFKPFVYLSAFQINEGMMNYTPSSILEDSELKLEYDGKEYKPRNYDDKYFGRVTIRTALEKSLNSATVRMGHEIGEAKIVAMAKKLGIRSDIKPYPSIALGSFEVSPIEMAQAYSIIANMGTKATLLSIKDVVSKDGEVLEKKTMQLERIIEPQRAYLINNILKGVFERGTASAAKYWGFNSKGSGKTGTSDDYRDSWFVGYTPELLSLSWVGFDKPREMKVTGATGALRLWAKFMKDIHFEEDIDFRIPENIVFKEVDPVSGLLAGRKCKDTIKEAYLKGTEPVEKTDCQNRVENENTD